MLLSRICARCGAKRIALFSSKTTTPFPVGTTPPSQGYETSQKSLITALPLSWQPYLRLIRFDRPIGTYLLYWPCTWSIAMATTPGGLPDWSLLATFGVGAFVMRGAGCTINDLWDRNYDGKVFRTASRPLPSGEITPFKGLVFLGAQLSVGLAILLSLNQYSILLGMASLPLVVSYPLMKRITFWPQAVLGMTFNWGALLGYSAVNGICDWSICIPLYAAAVSWTLLYDTIYAYQDVIDDYKLGLKSTALKFGINGKLWLTLFGSSMSSCLLLTGIQASLSWPYYLGVGVVSSHLLWQIFTVNLSNPVDCLRKFRSNNHIGIILFMAIVAAILTPNNNNNNNNNNIEK